jgi:formate dehydrogenase major subunit
MRPKSFDRMRKLPVVGRAADWGMGPRAASKKTRKAGARIAGLKATESICPYCAVGCGQVVYTRDGELVDIEGNPRSPINQGTLCPKGSASRQLVQQPGRLTRVKYRRPGGTEWEELELETAMDMIAERMIAAREHGWQDTDEGVHRHGRDPDREPGAHMTLLHGARSGDHVRARRRHHVPAGPAARGLHPHPGLEHGRGAPGRLPLGDEGA